MRDRLPYVRKKRGNLFWEPTPAMRDAGFLPKPLGPDTPDSRAEGRRLYQSWEAAKAARGKVTDYPAGSFGAFYDRYRRTPAWAKKGARTREDYERAWKHIDVFRPDGGPTLSRLTITRITTEHCEALADHLEATVSPSERWRAVKCLKVLLADAMVRLRLSLPSPAAKLVNSQPKGRSAIWLGGEIAQLSAGAAEAGYPGMSIAIAIAWETLFSPVDVWSLRRSALKQDGSGWYLERERTKTHKEAFGALSEATAAALLAYMDSLPFEMTPDTPMIRQRNGHAYRSKDTFGDDFRAVRKAVFPGDTRQFLDIRRSGNVEADAAGADKRTMGELLANGLADSRFLDDTYTPPTVTKAREVAIKRLAGRVALEGEVGRLKRSNSA